MELNENHFEYNSKTQIIDVNIQKDGVDLSEEKELIGKVFNLQFSSLFNREFSIDFEHIIPYLECLGISENGLKLSFDNKMVML
jgi:hypothetical protein